MYYSLQELISIHLFIHTRNHKYFYHCPNQKNIELQKTRHVYKGYGSILPFYVLSKLVEPYGSKGKVNKVNVHVD